MKIWHTPVTCQWQYKFRPLAFWEYNKRYSHTCSKIQRTLTGTCKNKDVALCTSILKAHNTCRTFCLTLGLTIINARGELLEAVKSLEVLLTRLNISYTLELRLDVYCKAIGNSSEEIAKRWPSNTLYPKKCLLCVICKVSNRKTLSSETFFFFYKCLSSIVYFIYVLQVTHFFFFLRAVDWPTDHLSWNGLLFSCNPIG